MQRLHLSDYVNHLKRGNSLTCVTPDRVRFQIQSKLSHGIAWYRAYPARKGCLNKFSRLTDDQLLQWLTSQKEVSLCND